MLSVRSCCCGAKALLLPTFALSRYLEARVKAKGLTRPAGVAINRRIDVTAPPVTYRFSYTGWLMVTFLPASRCKASTD